ncbi:MULTISPECIES: beta-propeller fold lactonase family protein [unclassified Amycolatopsis]|uniref:YncE family protein n=1 Tax=unclassified Amycolatopsis TaxID=2618356 RepID=UPI0034559DB5
MPWKRRISFALAIVAAAGGAVAVASSAASATDDGFSAVPPPAPVPVTSHDRVYTADQTSNTVTVIDPSANKVLGTIALGAQRLSNTLNPQYLDDENVHGLAYSPNRQRLGVVSIGSNTVDIIDTTTNKVLSHTDVGRASHEGSFTRDGREFWVADRGRDTVTIVDALHGGVIENLPVGTGPSKVVMSPDGRTAYVNHIALPEITVVDVASRRITGHITGLGDVFSSDLAISPDGRELWVPHKRAGKTSVVDLVHHRVQAVLTTGPDTNHPNFAGDFAYLTVGGLDETLVYRRSPGTPKLVATVHDTGHAPHGIWPSGDGSRMYVGMEKSDSVDVIDTRTQRVVSSFGVGQEPQALVYVPNAAPGGGAPNLGTQGLGQQGHDVAATLPDGSDGTTLDPATGRRLEVTVRPIAGLDSIGLQARGLAPNTTYTASSVDSHGARTTLVSFRTDAMGNAPQVLAFAVFTGRSVALSTGATGAVQAAMDDTGGCCCC